MRLRRSCWPCPMGPWTNGPGRSRGTLQGGCTLRATSRRNSTPSPRPARAADAVASFGGSWTFVGLFAAVMLLWVSLNAYLLMRHRKTFDPYPYILLNLFLSMLAAIQAPIILMSQNRQSEKDRISAGHDYEVN